MNRQIEFIKNSNPQKKPDFNNLGFGNLFTDHMFVMDYSIELGWHNAKIIPYGPLSLDPSIMALHYGQSIFEGLKAYKTTSNKILLFRPNKNFERINVSDVRMCMPKIDVDFCLHALKELITVEQDWIPTQPGTALYIRPFIFATDPFLGVRPSNTYKFIIILSPVGAYYKEGINPVSIFVETNYVRAVRGGVGYAKTIGNYAASLKAQVEAQENGFTQVLWLDALERKYIEEVGTMNIFFKINGEIITPSLDGSILPGITRLSSIELLQDMGLKVTERKISIDEVLEASKNNTLEECFGTGTAAVISPVGSLFYNNQKILINNGEIGEISSKLYSTLTKLQYGEISDKYRWTVEI